MTSPYLFWGAGAVGGTIAAFLGRAGHDVLLVDREPDHVAAINDGGLAIEGPIAGFTARLPALLPDQLEGKFDRILLSVKAHHTQATVAQLAPHLAPGGYVASIQNGLNEHVIAKALGADRVIGGFINFSADYLGPGRIMFGPRGAVVVGEIDGRSSERLSALHAALLDFEPEAKISDNIWGYLWGKMGYGTLLFATALTNETMADALGSERHAALYRRLATEVMTVAVTQVRQPEGFNGFAPAAFMAGAGEGDVARALAAMSAHNRGGAKTHSGIWRDLAVRKRKTEADAHLGEIVRVGEDAGLQTPLVRRLWAMIGEIERGDRPLSVDNLDALAATA